MTERTEEMAEEIKLETFANRNRVGINNKPYSVYLSKKGGFYYYGLKKKEKADTEEHDNISGADRAFDICQRLNTRLACQN